jgi:3-phosphoshikimate 1-carboxyvinyltransferase
LRGALVYVTPVEQGHGAADEVRDFWSRSVGAQPVVLSAERHDDLLAWTEHLPRAVTAVLAAALADNGPVGMTVPPGVRAATQLAEADPERWSAVLLANRERLLPALEAFRADLDDVCAALEEGDRARLRARLAAASAWSRGQRP